MTKDPSESDAEFEVEYDDDDDVYVIENLFKDWLEGSLVILDP